MNLESPTPVDSSDSKNRPKESFYTPDYIDPDVFWGRLIVLFIALSQFGLTIACAALVLRGISSPGSQALVPIATPQYFFWGLIKSLFFPYALYQGLERGKVVIVISSIIELPLNFVFLMTSDFGKISIPIASYWAGTVLVDILTIILLVASPQVEAFLEHQRTKSPISSKQAAQGLEALSNLMRDQNSKS